MGWGEGKKARNKVRNEERRGGGGGRGWRRERWEGVREGVMGMSVGKEEQEREWDGEWV